MTQSHDTLLRFLLPAAGVRGVAVSLDAAWQAIASRAHYPAAVSELLGEASAAAALFTGHTKVEGRLSIQLRGTGPVRTLFAECTAHGGLRGIAHLSEASAPFTGNLQQLGSDALLAITIENPALGHGEPMRYQGLVSLQASRLDAAFEDYFHQSEQLPTRILLACNATRAVGLMLQKLPGEEGDNDGFVRASALFDTLGSEELLALPSADIIHRLFHEESPELVASKPLRFACSCSRERVEGMLRSLGQNEADAAVIAGEGTASITCEFCGQGYHFDASAVDQLFSTPDPTHPPATSTH